MERQTIKWREGAIYLNKLLLEFFEWEKRCTWVCWWNYFWWINVLCCWHCLLYLQGLVWEDCILKGRMVQTFVVVISLSAYRWSGYCGFVSSFCFAVPFIVTSLINETFRLWVLMTISMTAILHAYEARVCYISSLQDYSHLTLRAGFQNTDKNTS